MGHAGRDSRRDPQRDRVRPRLSPATNCAPAAASTQKRSLPVPCPAANFGRPCISAADKRDAPRSRWPGRVWQDFASTACDLAVSDSGRAIAPSPRYCPLGDPSEASAYSHTHDLMRRSVRLWRWRRRRRWSRNDIAGRRPAGPRYRDRFGVRRTNLDVDELDVAAGPLGEAWFRA